MAFGVSRARILAAGMVGAALVASVAGAQTEYHRRGYKPLPPLAHIVVTVQKGYNGKPLENAAVIFHSTLDGRDDGSLEVKTDLDGNAAIDLIEVGSKVTVQVLADGFATFATDMNVDAENKALTVKLQRPQEQVSEYEDNTGKAAVRPLGVQEPDREVKVAAAAPVTTAKVSGIVKDATGAHIPGAIVMIVNKTAPGEPFKMATAKDGTFSRGNLAPGTYDITIQSLGFTPVQHSGVLLSAGDNRVMDEQLQPVATSPSAAVSPK